MLKKIITAEIKSKDLVDEKKPEDKKQEKKSEEKVEKKDE